MMRSIKKSRRKGFTVGELLIVVAIIAVLVSIAIPVLTNKLEKAREAYDIYTMRQAASAAIELYYAGITDAASANAAGLSWSDAGSAKDNNAYGAYNPANGKIYRSRAELPAGVKTYGKGTVRNGGTVYIMGNPTGAYAASEDYTNAVIMVSIYPKANPAYAIVYWKNNKGNTLYVGGEERKNVPKYSIKINLN